MASRLVVQAMLTVAILIVAVVVAVQDGATPVTVDGALERFRTEGQTSPPQTHAPSPPAATPTDVTEPGATELEPAIPDPSPPQETSDADPAPAADAGPDTVAPASDHEGDGASPTPDPTPAVDEPRPAEGVYVYATDGHDEIDAFGGRRHDYPSETTLTLRHTDCGTHTRWDVLDERWDEAKTCRTDNGDRQLQSIVSYREFLGHGQRMDLECDLLLPADPAAGARWSGTCTGEDTDVVLQMTMMGWETVTVGGRAAETIHVRTEAVFSGRSEGTQSSDRWYVPSTGLEVRTHTVTDVHSQGPTGRVHYQEQVRRELRELEPHR